MKGKGKFSSVLGLLAVGIVWGLSFFLLYANVGKAVPSVSIDIYASHGTHSLRFADVDAKFVAIVHLGDDPIPGAVVNWWAVPSIVNISPTSTVTDDCGVAGPVTIVGTGQTGFVTIYAKTYLYNHTFTASWDLTLTNNPCDSTEPPIWTCTRDIISPIHCDVTWDYLGDKFLINITEAAERWKAATDHIRLRKVASGAIIEFSDYCDSDPNSPNAKTICGRPIKVLLNVFWMAGGCPFWGGCPSPWPRHDVANVNTIAHEFGHAFGLDHAGGEGTLMYPSITSFYNCGIVSPTAADVSAINREYPSCP